MVTDTQVLDCGHAPSPHEESTTGYGVGSDGKTACYECCAIMDREQMDHDGRTTLYLTYETVLGNGKTWSVTNWPGSLRFPAYVKIGHHNIAGRRYDAWFRDHNGREWHGVTYGDMTQLCHCQRLKS